MGPNCMSKMVHNPLARLNTLSYLSLTGLYYHFSNYGESIVKPTIISAMMVGVIEDRR
jgi:hypothetical protein